MLYAWPHLELRQADSEPEQMSRERERLLEENRKLRLEKASLENLRRVETIARRDLGPAPAARGAAGRGGARRPAARAEARLASAAGAGGTAVTTMRRLPLHDPDGPDPDRAASACA